MTLFMPSKKNYLVAGAVASTDAAELDASTAGAASTDAAELDSATTGATSSFLAHATTERAIKPKTIAFFIMLTPICEYTLFIHSSSVSKYKHDRFHCNSTWSSTK